MFLQWLTPSLTWRKETDDKAVYLTFDDGPVPQVTPWVLDFLEQKKIRATFFCVGENVVKHPDIYARILNEGHAIGNHTFNHMPLYKTGAEAYKANIKKAREVIDSDLFRPPHGQMNNSMIGWLKKQDYKIIMWDVLTADYDKDRTPEMCFESVKRKTRPGSIILFHDSLKAQKNLKGALPLSVEHLLKNAWKFKTLR